MEPLIRNYRNHHSAGGPAARLVSLDDNPPTCTLSYSHILPGETSSHHIHPWEHEVYMIKGSGTLFCDGKEYPVKAGDAIFIPGNVDHYTLNNGGDEEIQRIEINPLSASQSGGSNNNGGTGTGEPPVIKNLPDIDTSPGAARPVLTADDGAANYTLSHRGMATGEGQPGAYPRRGTPGLLSGRQLHPDLRRPGLRSIRGRCHLDTALYHSRMEPERRAGSQLAGVQSGASLIGIFREEAEESDLYAFLGLFSLLPLAFS